MSYIQFTAKERGQIEVLTRLHYSICAIGRELNRAPSTISRDLKRARHRGDYRADARNRATKSAVARSRNTPPAPCT